MNKQATYVLHQQVGISYFKGRRSPSSSNIELCFINTLFNEILYRSIVGIDI